MSDSRFLKNDQLKSLLSRIKTRVESGIANAISDSASTLNSSISNGDTSTLNSAKSYADGLKTTIDSSIASNLATAKGYTDGAKTALETNIGNHTGNTNNPHNVTYIQIGAAPTSHSHVEADISDLGSYATNSDLNSYGVSSVAFDDSTSVLTITMKDNSTKTATITGVSSSGSGSSSVTLQDLGGASATDLSNHTGDTSNPHSVTYTQTGAAAASHTHTESDITDLGNYASSSHTHTESDITDLGNYSLSGHSHTESDITDLGNYASSSHSHTVSDITDASTELASKSHTHVESDITDLGNYANSSHTHTESDITDLGSYASSSHTHTVSDITDSSSLASSNDISTLTTAINNYGVSSISINSSTGVLTLTMKDNSTKTVTIPLSSGGGNSGASITAINYDDSDEELVFTLDNNSTVTCDISDLISQLNITYESLDPRTYNSEWVDRMTGSGTELDPYLIYTPKDFIKINEDMTAHYKLMNNLDFAPVTGLQIEVEGDSYQTTTIDNTAPLYHNGEGFWPIGYNGYFPINSTSALSTSTWNPSSSPSNGLVKGDSSGTFTRDYYIFIGELDGNSKFIKGIACSPVNTYAVALFSFISSNASIHNLTIKDSVFMVNDVYVGSSDKESSLSSFCAFITSYTTTPSIAIKNVYNYATLINNRTTNSGSDCYIYTSGICGPVESSNWSSYLVSIKECANHGKIIFTNSSLYHKVSGIFNIRPDTTNQIVENCVNYSNLYGSKIYGIGNYVKGVNMNFGTVTRNVNGTSYAHAIASKNPAYYNVNQAFTIISNWETSYVDGYSDRTSYENAKKVKFKTIEELKSEAFVTEANSYLSSNLFIYNDLNVCDGFPLLIDEYNQYVGVNGNLNLALVDPLSNKIHKSGYTLEKLQKSITHDQIATEINQKMNSFNATQFAGVKIVEFTITTNNWSLDSNINKYKATKNDSGLVASSPVQLLKQFTSDNIEIGGVSTGYVTFISDTLPSSSVRVALMFIK